MDRQRFAGKSVFITGAASGIGYETALAFAREGAAIVATDMAMDGLEPLREEIATMGVSCICERLDVTDEQAFVKLLDELASRGSLPDIAVNNAGIGHIDSFANTDTAAWRRTLEVNVLGVAIGCRLFINHWQRSGRPGHLVNVSSAASIAPPPNLSAYAASKYAVEGLCEVLQLELWGSAIRVSCVHPGVIDTPIVTREEELAIPAEQIERLQRYYRERGAPPSAVARDIVEGVLKCRASIFSGPGSTFAPVMKRLLPRSLYRKLLRASARKVGYL
jgi:NAD(P)-dependent dehydrogenase (short-subunit alcohol dehydrogenase family)